MPVAGGLSAQLGFAEESVFGTAVTPTRFFEPISENIKFSRERIESKGLRTGRRSVGVWVPGREGGEGSIEFEVMPNGFGILAKHMLGTIATVTPGGGTISRTHTAKVGAIDGKSLTVQIGRTPRSGTPDSYTYTGGKVAGWELSMASNGVLECKLDMDFSGEDTVTALATASYPASNVLIPFTNVATSITIGGTSYDVDKITLAGKNMLASDRYRLGSPRKMEQLEGANLRSFNGTIDLESYAGLTPYNLFVNGTEAQIIATFTGPIIEGAIPYQVKVTLPRCRFDGTTVAINGPKLIEQAIPFEALWTAAATTEVQIEVNNTDVAP